MWQKILTGVIINVGCYLIGRKVEQYCNETDELKRKLKEQENAQKIVRAADALTDNELDELRKEFTE